ncbi:MAG: hypothetical protein AB7I04_18405 [Pseudomonadales bacterium]
MNEPDEKTKLARLWANPVLRKLLNGGLLLVPTRAADQLPAADEKYAYQQIAIRNVPGTSAGKLYICLPDDGATPTWAWVEVATG